MDRPNVLWICTDQHQYSSLSCADHPVIETPNIDRIARYGVQFTDAYCPSPVCGPSRAALFSGRYPRNNGVDGNWEPFNDGVTLLPELLSEAGYQTSLIGKLHLTPTHSDHGFDLSQRHDTMNACYNPECPEFSAYVKWLAERSYDGDISEVVRRANADERSYEQHRDMLRFLLGSDWRSEDEHSTTWIGKRTREYLRAEREEPFFCFTSYFGPHQPMKAPGRWGERYDPEEIPLPPEREVSIDDKPVAQGNVESGGVLTHFERYGWDDRQYREVLAAYYGQIEMIDASIGRILDELEEQGLRENTIVVFTADHGDHATQFGWFFKGTMYEGSARVPLLIEDPTGVSGEECSTVVNTLDLFETVLSRCGVDHEIPSPSRDLTPLCRDPASANGDSLTFVDHNSSVMVVDGDDKLIRGTDPFGDPAYELYDRTSRPDDAENRWDHPEYTTERATLLEQLKEIETALEKNPAEAFTRPRGDSFK